MAAPEENRDPGQDFHLPRALGINMPIREWSVGISHQPGLAESSPAALDHNDSFRTGVIATHRPYKLLDELSNKKDLSSRYLLK